MLLLKVGYGRRHLKRCFSNVYFTILNVFFHFRYINRPFLWYTVVTIYCRKFLWEPQKLKWKRTFKIEKKTFKKQFFQMSSSKAYFLQKHLMKLGLARSYIIFWLGHWSNQSLKLCPFNLYMSATYLFLLLESWKFDRDTILVID